MGTRINLNKEPGELVAEATLEQVVDRLSTYGWVEVRNGHGGPVVRAYAENIEKLERV